MRSFKKNLQVKVKINPEKLLYFFDESRFGTHSKRGYGWFKKGSRTAIYSKLRFKSFYLYTAVNVANDEDFTLTAPNVNTVCMNVFLQGLSKSLGTSTAYLVIDCAGWHLAKDLKIPSNIEIIYLPPYSPELNPVERFWQYVKNYTIKNRIFESLEELEMEINKFFRALTPDIVKSICSINYLSI